MATPIQIQKRLALRLKLNKIDNLGISAPILLNEILAKNKYKTKLVQGYCSLGGETCWHIWVVINDNEPVDINYTIACLHDTSFINRNMILHMNILPGAPAPTTDTENTDNWELYQSDHHAFWKKQPIKLQNMRAKLINTVW